MRQPLVFVVDDEDQIRGLLARILTRDGMRVVPFGTAAEALAALESDRPDIVVTDLMMPGTNGLELAARARSLLPDVSVVVITGYASLENVVDALRSGVDDFVTKPFGAAEFRAVIARVLERRARPAAATAPSPPSPEAAPPPAAGTSALARRVREMTLLEAIHAFLAEDLASRDLLARAMPTLEGALGTTRAALLLRTDDTWRVAATGGPAPAATTSPPAHTALADALDGGSALAIPPGAQGALAAWTGTGPSAAAALGARPRAGEENGVLVVARPASGAPFAADDLRTLASAASAIGDVFRSIRAAERVEEAYAASLLDVVTASESRSPWFRDHSVRVRDVAVALGRRAGLDPDDLEVLSLAARLLDLGRVQIPDGLLDKPARLSPDEWRAVRGHSEAAERIVRPLGRLRHVQPVVRHHHENWDGTGYPDGLRGDDIPFLASVARIADAYAALVEPRPWREPLAPDAALRSIVEGSGTRFHPELVAAFAELPAGDRAAPDSVREATP